MTRTDPTPRDPYECPECGFSASAERLKARAEGRQQAVREAKEQLLPIFDRHHRHTDAYLFFQEEVAAILDRVAGLNASESPPKSWMERGTDGMNEADERAMESGPPPEREAGDEEPQEYAQRIRGLSHKPGSRSDCSPLLCGHQPSGKRGRA